ncbi:hypothetical protein Unana1_00940 [Umbelopsis nana]
MPLRTVLSPLNHSEGGDNKNAALKDAANAISKLPSKEKNLLARKIRSPKRATKKSTQPVNDENQNLILEQSTPNNKPLKHSNKGPLIDRLQEVEPRDKPIHAKRKVSGNNSPRQSYAPSPTRNSNSPVKKRKTFGGKTIAHLNTGQEPVEKISTDELKNMSRHYEEAAPQTPKKSHSREPTSSSSPTIIITPKRPSYAQRHQEPRSPLAHRQKMLSPLSSPALEAVDLSKLAPRPTKPLLFQTCHKIWPHGTTPTELALSDVKPLTLMLKERLARAKFKVFSNQEQSVAQYTIPPLSHTTHQPGDSDTTVGNSKNFFSRHTKHSARAEERKQYVEAAKSIFTTVIADNDFKAVELVTDADGRMSLALTPLTEFPLLPPPQQRESQTSSPLDDNEDDLSSTLSLSPFEDDIQELPKTPSPKSSRLPVTKLGSGKPGHQCGKCQKHYKNARSLKFHTDRCKAKKSPKTKVSKAEKGGQKKGGAQVRSDDEEWDEGVTNCICAMESDKSIPMVQCDDCESWLHLECIGLDEDNLEEEYFCPRCKGDHVSPPSSCHRSTGGKTVAGALEVQKKLQARLQKIKASQSGNRNLLDRFVQEANNAYLETKMKQRTLPINLEDDDTDAETLGPNTQDGTISDCEDVLEEEATTQSGCATPTHQGLHVWEGFSLNVSPDSEHVWGTSDAFGLSQPSEFLLDDEALNASLTQKATESTAAPAGTTTITSNDTSQPDYGHTTTPADLVALSLKQHPPSSDMYMGSLIDDDDVGTSFASPMTDGEERHWNPMIKASPYLYMDETDVITPFAIKMSDAGYFDLTSLPLNAADTWLVTGDNGDVVTDALEQDFDGLINLDA